MAASNLSWISSVTFNKVLTGNTPLVGLTVFLLRVAGCFLSVRTAKSHRLSECFTSKAHPCKGVRDLATRYSEHFITFLLNIYKKRNKQMDISTYTSGPDLRHKHAI